LIIALAGVTFRYVEGGCKGFDWWIVLVLVAGGVSISQTWQKHNCQR